MNLPLAQTQSVVPYLKYNSGEVIEIATPPVGVWKRATCSVPEESLELLASVEPYDDTAFDFRSAPTLAVEIAHLRRHAHGEDAKFFDKVIEFAQTVARNKNLILVFVGD